MPGSLSSQGNFPSKLNFFQNRSSFLKNLELRFLIINP